VHKQFLTPPLAVHLTRLRLLCLFAQKSSSESFLASRASYTADALLAECPLRASAIRVGKYSFLHFGCVCAALGGGRSGGSWEPLCRGKPGMYDGTG